MRRLVHLCVGCRGLAAAPAASNVLTLVWGPLLLREEDPELVAAAAGPCSPTFPSLVRKTWNWWLPLLGCDPPSLHLCAPQCVQAGGAPTILAIHQTIHHPPSHGVLTIIWGAHHPGHPQCSPHTHKVATCLSLAWRRTHPTTTPCVQAGGVPTILRLLREKDVELVAAAAGALHCLVLEQASYLAWVSRVLACIVVCSVWLRGGSVALVAAIAGTLHCLVQE